MAFQNNRDLGLSVLNVLEAQAQSRVAFANRLPWLEAQGNKRVSGGEGQSTLSSYGAEVMVPAFELDFWGRLKNLETSALENYLGSQEALRAYAITLTKTLVSAYVEERLLAQKEKLSSQTLRAYQDSLAFVEERVISGQSTLLELEQARGQVAYMEAELLSLKSARTLAENALKLIIGDFNPQNLPQPWELTAWEPWALNAQIPSEVLLNRPDVLEAEHALKASHADIGAARAAFFPRLSLTSALGLMSPDLSNLFKNGTLNWSFTPTLGLPIFSGGSLRANYDLSLIRRSKAILNYEKILQTAFREVADALLVKEDLKAQVTAREKYLATQRRVLALATNRYQNGAVSYLEVLEAQRNVLEAEMSLLDARADYLNNSINLYAALGGAAIVLLPDRPLEEYLKP
jgi:Cu(I)/Ag(I) efflux system outer membrane protein